MSLLSARGLWAAPPGAKDCVVRDFTLDLEPGQWLAITGGNGSGKTTLAHALAGLWPIERGELRLEDAPFGPHQGPAARSVVGVLMQDPASQLLQGTLADELAFAARNLDRSESEIAARTARWVERLQLPGESMTDPRALSAGGQQLTLIAAAMVAAPRLLIADEPAAHLDSATRARVLAAMREEVDAGLAVVWVSQDPAEIAAADRCLTLGEVGGLEAPADAMPERTDGTVVMRLRVRGPSSVTGPRIHIVEPLELELMDRGVTAFLGPNGAGKSVLLAAATGAGELDQVTVEWTGGAAPPPILASQYPELQLFEEQVEDELIWAAVKRGLGRAEALDLASRHLRALGFEPGGFLERRAWDLSGGEKRLVVAIAAMIAPARLLGLDEPTAGLDPARRSALAGLVARRAERGPVIIASQDAGWVGGLSSRTIRLGV